MNKKGSHHSAKVSKSYRRKIYTLCKRATKGDSLALKKLEQESHSNPKAKGIIQFWFNKKRTEAEVKRQNKDTLSPEKQAKKDRVQHRGFDDGALVPGSHIRKVDK